METQLPLNIFKEVIGIFQRIFQPSGIFYMAEKFVDPFTLRYAHMKVIHESR